MIRSNQCEINFGTKIKKLYLTFMICAVIGWLYEVFLEVVVYRWRFTNRGVLFGPYCPVYGFGALFSSMPDDQKEKT